MHWPELLDLDFSPEFEFRTARSGGPGGQHVNKTESKVELRFDLAQSQLLDEAQRAYLLKRLENKLLSEGVLSITCQEKRSQHDNRATAIKKFYAVLEKALQERKRRIPTKPGAGVREARLKTKKVQSEKKTMRQKPPLS
jgi:ribosome-associated protein